MMSFLRGTILEIKEQAVTLGIGPMGASLHVPVPGIFQIGKETKLYTYLHWNAEQGPSLFGFSSEIEKTVFLLVISCSGLGPKIAMAVLADLGPDQFLQAIQEGEDKVLSKVSGIGAKKAEQTLKHKVAKLIKSGIDLGASEQFKQWNNMMQVLESLSYSRSEIHASMNFLKENHAGQNLPFDQMMRHALSFLAKKG